jgi:hypothetical protein
MSVIDANGPPSGAGSVTIVPSIHSSLGPKLQVIDMRPSGRDLDVPDGQRATLPIPAEGGR